MSNAALPDRDAEHLADIIRAELSAPFRAIASNLEN